MRYDRKIKYFDYRMDGERVQGAGFVKMELRDEKCRLQFRISGLHATDNFTKEIYLIGGGREVELCRISISNGKGDVQLELHPDDLCGGIGYEEIDAFRVTIAAGRELYCGVSDKVVILKNKEESIDENEGSRERRGEGTSAGIREKVDERILGAMINETLSERTDKRVDEMISGQIEERIDETISGERDGRINETISAEIEERIDETISGQIDGKEDRGMNDIGINASTNQEIEMAGEEPEMDIISPTVKMSESKWKQLSAIYPHVQPFGDERDYLKVGPQDFVVLSGRSYQLVHNSFLLHGYYNYQHMILTRQEGRGEIRYYIGVPGNFYEREKQVAVMFGFESFECKKEPANMGDYGYYMIRVDL